jgi:hypothetical protein
VLSRSVSASQLRNNTAIVNEGLLMAGGRNWSREKCGRILSPILRNCTVQSPPSEELNAGALLLPAVEDRNISETAELKSRFFS